MDFFFSHKISTLVLYLESLLVRQESTFGDHKTMILYKFFHITKLKESAFGLLLLLEVVKGKEKAGEGINLSDI